MTKEEVINLAQKAGLWEIFEQYSGEFSDGNPEVCLEELERFAALVVANNPPQSWMSYQEGYEAGQQAGRLAERERICKQIAMMHDSLSLTGTTNWGKT